MSRPEPGALRPAVDSVPIRSGSRLFGTYEVEAELGAGGMGAVYRVRHTATGEVRAAKVIHQQVSRDTRLEQLFTREARVLAQLRHPGVVRYLDLLRDGDRLVLLMEYAEGEHLGRRLLRGALPASDLEGLLHHLADALASVHAADVVHRDISPDNIILRDGNVSQPTLIDFGIAADDSDSSSTIVEGFKGKLAYASPEQLGVHGTRVGAPADIYSLGLVMAFAASGEPIPMGRTLYEAVQCRSVVPELPANIPSQLAGFIKAMLAPHPAHRPTAIELRDRTSSSLAQVSQVGATSPVSPRMPDDEDAVTVLPVSMPPREEIAAPRPAVDRAPKHAVPAAPDSFGIVGLLANSAASGFGLGIGVALWCATHLGQPSGVVSAVPRTAASSQSALLPSTIFHGANISTPPAPTRGVLSTDRQTILANAERFTRVAWRMDARNVVGACVRSYGYRSDFPPGSRVEGVAYDWGGNDTPEVFVQKLGASYAAGSHSWHGVSPCTAGIDCSGFVGQAWGLAGRGKLSTASLGNVARSLGAQWGDRLLPGDALNRAGRHVVLYAGRSADGRPVVFEALAAASRVIRNDRVTWARLRRYAPMRLRTLANG